MRLLRNPLAQFLVAGTLTLLVVFLATGRLSDRAASEEAIEDAVATTELLARSVAEPAIPRGLVDGDPAALDRFDRAVVRRLMVDDVQRIKIWNAEGAIVYSDDTRLIGERFALGPAERQVLLEGGRDAEESDLSKPENRYERSSGGLVEVYTRIRSPEGEPLLFEAYYSAADIAARRAEIFSAFRPITLGALGVLALVTVPMLWVLTRRLDRVARDRERLLRAAVDASDAERRRIARDLHDTVVQELAGTAFSLSAAARGGETDTAELERLGASVRKSLRGLRSLLVEIHPPEVTTAGLQSALEDLVAAAGEISTDVETGDLTGLDDRDAALVWRVAQEAVRNSLRHAAPALLAVRVDRSEGITVLEVSDDGRGFDLGLERSRTHFGLRGLESLVRDAGGRVVVRSEPGAGTTVRMELG